MTQEMLDRLIGAAPPSTVDIDTVITRVRRRRRFQRLAATGSAGVAVVLAALVGVSLTGGPPRPVTPQPAAPPVATPVTPSGVRHTAVSAFAVEAGTAAGQQRTLSRLRVALEKATAEHAPGTRWIYMPDSPGEKRTPDGHPAMWLNRDPVSFEARSGLTAGGRKGGFYLSIRPATCAAGESCSPLAECDRTIPDCAVTRTDIGLALVHWREQPGNGWNFYGADVLLRGGRYAMRLQAVNYFGGDGSPPVASVPVLTRAQLDAIAIDVSGQIGG
ncbi:hypothetical protein [Actinoplanes awajinensis]|uniref:Uncharacterized protein n=1 Tax=Actinoplanes awajinensis subsp. mycoplanecinus TaxID=135947 RepID=A0A117MS97_9ACTN|nr:hypothetical protein [Actinoplanes awajinensis]KUL33042.1 hypothetical protein ADL15_18695 [Actinoplanes awajinensis subsp. mycoplanecinus]